MDSYRFRWIVCQLQALMNTFPSAIRRALDNMPEGLDGFSVVSSSSGVTVTALGSGGVGGNRREVTSGGFLS